MDEEIFTFGSFRLIPARRILFKDGKPLRLGSRAFDILTSLTERAGQTISKEELIARAWPGTVVEEASLSVQVAALRKALDDGRTGTRHIATLSGRGYAFIAPVTRENALLATAAPTGTVEVGNLPVLLTRVVGRDGVISRLAQQLVRCRFLTIVGPGGIGKTTVAVALAGVVRASYGDGAWYVELASLSDPNLVPSALCALLGIALLGANPLSGLAASLRDKHILIVLDSCEHVIGAAAALAEAILKAAPHAGIVATSREPLRAEGEWLHRLASLELPPQERASATAAEALGYSAVELFNEHATAATDRFALYDADVPAVLEICRRLDGVPLAIELAAARVDTLGVSELTALLDDRFGVLTSGRRTALPRQQTLRATIDWSYNLLPELEQVIFGRLAHFRGAFTIDAAVAVAIDERITVTNVIEGVANLAEKSLLATDITGNITRHRLLDTTRLYALGKLDERGELQSAARRHAEYYQGLFDRAEGEARTRPISEWLGDYSRHLDNLRAALDWCFSPVGSPEIGVALTATAIPLWLHLSLLHECRTRVEKALTILRSGSRTDAQREMKMLAALAQTSFYTKGAINEIEVVWTKTLQIAQLLDNAEYQLRALWGLWAFRITAGQCRLSLETAQEFSRLARTQPDQDQIGERMVGLSQHFLGNQASARRHFEHLLANFALSTPKLHHVVRFGYDQRVAARSNLARVLWLQGYPRQASLTAEAAVEEARATNHAASLCYALANSACPIALRIGDLAAAEHYVEVLVDDAARLALFYRDVVGPLYQAVLRIRRGEIADGLVRLRAGVQDASLALLGAASGVFLGELVECLAGAGHVDDALALLQQEKERYERNEEGWLLAELLRLNGELVLQQGGPSAAPIADGYFRQALDLARRQGALAWELRTANSLARLLRTQGRSADAMSILQPVYDRFIEGFETADLRSARALLDTLG
jgi:predicted ATPase/DNA-binding winged helix-turn-helix (wHTH) protein